MFYQRKVLFGSVRNKLTVGGGFLTTNKYVLPNHNTPLLSRNALLKLGLLTFDINLVDVDEIQKHLRLWV